MGSAPEEQLEAEGQGISNDATQHKQHEYRVSLEGNLVWKCHLDQSHGCGNSEAKYAMVDHKCDTLEWLELSVVIVLLASSRGVDETEKGVEAQESPVWGRKPAG
ncbi:hypothetical protein Pyn_18439 [Prunus yedoensis var. nudiflora]|uniref:Uncharacterized protein n=1 Tax=Prunus yedoensis var. nudiflora TaxID=2094558 RepID=A0A314ZGA1_PRUYE|nr:hypothetical protein Pyn_18439 [Prunus yedoensis var. nudiflora]